MMSNISQFERPPASMTVRKEAFSVEELAAMTSLSQKFLRTEIKNGSLKAKRFGARVLILATEWERYANSRADYDVAA